MGALRMNSRALFQGKVFWISSALMLAVMWFSETQSELLYMALPIIAALPYTNSLLDDMTSGFWKFTIHRTSRREYLLSKVFICWIAGAAVVMIAGVICSIPPFLLIMYCFCGGACALLGMAFSLITGSRATACFAPFLSEYFLVILSTRYFPNAAVLNPQRWISFGMGGLLLPLGISVLCGVVCWKLGERRFTQ